MTETNQPSEPASHDDVAFHTHTRGAFEVQAEFESTALSFPGPTSPDDQFATTVALTVRNGGDAPIAFTFGNGQLFEIELVDDAGEVVTRWSEGMVFTQAIIETELPARASWRFEGELPLGTGRSGQYLVRIYLTADLSPGAQSPLHLQFGP